jgi:hypothetical protein
LHQNSQAALTGRGLMRPSGSQVRNHSIMENHEAGAMLKCIQDRAMEWIVIPYISNEAIE